MYNGATDLRYSVEVTQPLTEEDLQVLRLPYVDEFASSSDNGFQAQEVAATYLEVYQGRQALSIHQLLCTDVPVPYPRQPTNDISMLSLLFSDDAGPSDVLVNRTQDPLSDGSGHVPTIRHISPLMLTLPEISSDTRSPEMAASTSTAPAEKITTRGSKRTRSSADLSRDSDSRARKRMRPTVSRPMDYDMTIPAIALHGGALSDAQRTRKHDPSSADRIELPSPLSDATDEQSSISEDTVMLSPPPAAARRKLRNSRPKSARDEYDEAEWKPPYSAGHKPRRARRSKRAQTAPSLAEEEPPAHPRRGEKLACPVPGCSEKHTRAGDLERHVRFVDKPHHLQVQVYCTNDVHPPEKQSRLDNLVPRHMQKGKCMDMKGWRKFIQKAVKEGKIAERPHLDAQKVFATRTYAKCVLHCRKDPRYEVLNHEVCKELNFKSPEKLEQHLAEETEVIFRCRCCKASRTSWADAVDNYGCWEWDEDQQTLKRKSVSATTSGEGCLDQ